MTSVFLGLPSLLHCLAFAVIARVGAYDRPIVGVLTQRLNVELDDFQVSAELVHENLTMIAASYVKFAESAGARVVPIHYDAPVEVLRELFGKINGIIFPGGGVSIFNTPDNTYRQTAELLYNMAVKANDNGDVFPIVGTCLGFQLLSVITAQDDGVICRRCFKSEGLPLPLDFTPAAKSSTLFAQVPTALLKALGSENITENSHSSGVTPQAFDDNRRLHDFYRVLSTNIDAAGRQFVSTFEARDYPFTATQWHPEKNNFEWGSIGALGERAIPHSANAVAVSQYFANAFIANARQSQHQFPSEAAASAELIDNNAAVKDPQGYYSQVYLWRGGYPGPKSSATSVQVSDVVV